jgi:hypothetical protein
MTDLEHSDHLAAYAQHHGHCPCNDRPLQGRYLLSDVILRRADHTLVHTYPTDVLDQLIQ